VSERQADPGPVISALSELERLLKMHLAVEIVVPNASGMALFALGALTFAGDAAYTYFVQAEGEIIIQSRGCYGGGIWLPLSFAAEAIAGAIIRTRTVR
jgi:hypothetical protein